MIIRFFLATFAAVWPARQRQVPANDTSASLNAGGLVCEKSAAIQMKSEAMTISPALSSGRHFHEKCAAATY